MNPISAVDFRNRPLEVKVFDRCDKCETLQPDVKERSSCWVPKTVSCAGCFSKLVADAQNLICC